MLNNEAQAATYTNMFNPSARTASANSAFFDVRDYEGDLVFILHTGTVSGTTPTMDAVVGHNSTGTGGTSPLSGTTATQVTASTNFQTFKVPAGSCDGYVRMELTIAGTSPSFTCCAIMIGRKKYV